MSGISQPKASMRTRLANGDYLTLTVWAGKTDPNAEVITVQIRHPEGDQWETTGRMAAYRTSDGTYSQLPERTPAPKPAQKSSAIVSICVFSFSHSISKYNLDLCKDDDVVDSGDNRDSEDFFLNDEGI